MKERELQAIVKDKLDSEGFIYWFPPRTWGERDILGVFDFIATKNGRVIFVQMTTIQHISERIKKIQNFYRTNNIKPIANVFVWAYNPKKSIWKTTRVT